MLNHTNSIFAPRLTSLACLLVSIVSSSLYAAIDSQLALSNKLEMIKITNVGETSQSISYLNNYVDPIITCTYEIPSTTNIGTFTAVRLSGVTPAGFNIKAQAFFTSQTSIPSNAFCLVAESGVHTFDEGGDTRTVVAGKVTSSQAETAKQGDNGANRLGDNITGSTAGNFTSQPALFAQVMTSNNAGTSVAWTNNCATRAGNPQAQTSGRACVGKHTGRNSLNTVSSNETVGWIAIESGNGITDAGVRYDVGVTSNNIEGVGNISGNTARYGRTLSTSPDGYNFGVGTQAGENGGDMGVAHLHNTSSLANDRIQFAIDDQNRTHIDEPVSYIAAAPSKVDLTITKTVSNNLPKIGETITFSLEVGNNGPNTAQNVSVSDILPAGFELVAGSINGGDSSTVNGSNLNWTINSLLNGASETISFQVVVKAAP